MTMIIAECGVNHNGDPVLAQTMIEAAKRAGADAVKFQMFDPEKLEPPGPRRDMLRPLVLEPSDFQMLKACSDSHGLEFIVTPFDVESLDFVVRLGVNYIKIGSADLRNLELLDAARGRRVILSTGMATSDDLGRALDTLVGWESTARGPILLHCTSSYPAPSDEVNLRAMLALQPLGDGVGLSDHTLSTVIPAAAVAMGASVIEKHMTLDRRMSGPDHRASLEPRDFSEMVANIREVEAALGDGVKRPMPSEAEVMKVRDEREKWRCAS
ncbi:MAG: N-acetylneuraminate synthase family protein [Geminicoccaceae bacterium]